MIRCIFQKEFMLVKRMHKKMRYLSLFIFLNKGFTFEPYPCNSCPDSDSMQESMNVYTVFIFWYMSKDDAINIIKNSNLNEKS